MDSRRLLIMCASRVACDFATNALRNAMGRASDRINSRVVRAQALRSFSGDAKLDVPTSERPEFRSGMRALRSGALLGQTVVWGAVHTTFNAMNGVVRVGTHAFVLINVLRGHRDMVWMGVIPLFAGLYSMVKMLGFSRAQTGEYSVPWTGIGLQRRAFAHLP